MPKFFRGGGTSPDPTPTGEGATPSLDPTPVGAVGASIRVPSALDWSTPEHISRYGPAVHHTLWPIDSQEN